MKQMEINTSTWSVNNIVEAKQKLLNLGCKNLTPNALGRESISVLKTKEFMCFDLVPVNVTEDDICPSFEELMDFNT
jgi:hypothetical protein